MEYACILPFGNGPDIAEGQRQAPRFRAASGAAPLLPYCPESAGPTLVEILGNVLDASDPDTSRHNHRVSFYSALLAREAGCDLATQRKVFIFSSLHDIGKIGIPRAILRKPGPLTAEERDTVRRHVEIGSTIARRAHADSMLQELTLYHHEWWNGAGYPRGLTGTEIPLVARIVAIADVFDALLSERPYKKRVDFDAASAIIMAGSGSHFDPVLVDAFRHAHERLQEFSSRCLVP